MSRRAFRIALAVILGLALAVRLGAVERYGEIEPVTDALDYDRHAVSIANGHGYAEALPITGGPGPSAFRPPLYPYVLGGVYAISGTANEDKRRAYGRTLQALLGTAIVALIALIAFQLWGRGEALAAAAIAAVFPPLILAGTTLLSEPLFLVLFLGGVAAMLRYRQADERWGWLALAGACAGLGTLTRTNGVIAIALFAIAAWTLRPRLSWRALRTPAIVVASALVAIAPWTIRNAVELEAFVPVSTQTGFALTGQYNDVAAEQRATWLPPFEVPEYRPVFAGEPLGEVELDRRLRRLATDYARENPGHVVAAGFWNTLRFFNLHRPVATERRTALHSGQPQGLAQLSVYAFWLLVPLAIAGCFTPAARRVPLFVWLALPLFMLSVVFVVAMTRYRTLIDPFLILLAAAALAWAWRRLAPAAWRARPSVSSPPDVGVA